MHEQAQKNIRDRCMEEMVIPVTGDVRAIPAPGATFSLVVSRGSFHSWEDFPAAFREIYRVLEPGGMAYIGGGYGSARLRDEVQACRGMRGIMKGSVPPVKSRFRKIGSAEIAIAMEVAGIRDYRIISDDSGFWIVFRKNDDPRTSPENQLDFRHGFFFT
jgi:SAM-dependent methyltransferase